MADAINVQVPAAPEAEKYPDGSPIKKGALSAEFWPSEAKALEIAKGRTKGARRACSVKSPDGKIRYATTTHPHYLEEYILLHELKWEINEIGKVAAAKAPVTAAGVQAAIDALPEAEREAIKKQLADFLKASVAPKK